MSIIEQLIFWILAFCIVYLFKLIFIYYNDLNQYNLKLKLKSSKSLKTFQHLLTIENNNSNTSPKNSPKNSPTIIEVLSNENCSYCGKYLNINSINTRYFAHDTNICSICYIKLNNSFKD